MICPTNLSFLVSIKRIIGSSKVYIIYIYTLSIHSYNEAGNLCFFRMRKKPEAVKTPKITKHVPIT